jgi:signal transduction histidine kinase
VTIETAHLELGSPRGRDPAADRCAHRSAGRDCPISKTACPGECTFARILDDIDLGIVGLDMRRQEVFFQNKLAIELFRSTIRPRDFRALSSLLLGDGPAPVPNQRRRIRYGNRFIGYTSYCISEHYWWICLSDVTERERLAAVAEAVNAVNNLGYVFAGIRHELGNPINSIKTTVTVLRDALPRYSGAEVEAFLDRVLADVTRVEHLLRDLKSFGMYETPDVQKVDVGAFLEDLLAMLRPDAEARGVRIRTLLRPDARWAFLDPRALQHVVLNVITNAIDSLKGRADPLVAVTATRVGGRIALVVKDNGCGMADDFKPHLFKPFFSTKTHGTGLGLVIARKMITTIDGTMSIDSQEGVGTAVTLDVPAWAGT